jgi:phytanoyl-CoA hydroxylase
MTEQTRELKKLSQEQVGSYQERGYLIVEDVLSSDELKELREASGRLQEEREKTGGSDRLAVIHNVALLDEAFMKAARHPVMLGAVSDLIGENLRLQHCKLNWKPPARGAGKVEWHQDFPFFPHSNYGLLACMILLDDATVENGCMRVIPGSHKLGPVNHYDEDGNFAGHCTDQSAFDGSEAVDLVVKAGSMTIHHCCTLHSSYPNNSDTPRRGLVYQISAGDSVQLGGNLHKVQKIWLKGEDPLQARLEGGPTFRLPAPLTNRGGLEPTGNWRTVTED